jgi:glycosyltransferase involved in cell wall biosynthesis
VGVAYIRTVRTASAATAVQIVHSNRRGSREIEHIGSAHSSEAVEALKAVARQRLHASQDTLDFGDGRPEGQALPITSTQSKHLWDALRLAYARLGFDTACGADEVFQALVLASDTVAKLLLGSQRRVKAPLEALVAERSAGGVVVAAMAIRVSDDEVGQKGRGLVKPRVVIAHDYLSQRGGAERVVLSLLRAFPGARVVSSVYAPDQTYAEFQQFDVETSFLNRVPALRRDPRLALPLLAKAWDSLRVDDAHVVICSSSGWSHGVRAAGKKIVYCHNPARWLYQPEVYLSHAPRFSRLALSILRPTLVAWDRRKAATADRYIANSTVVKERIRAIYGLEADVMHPPAAVNISQEQQSLPGLRLGYVLTVSRSRGYKNVEVVCQALARRPDLTLVVLGGLPSGIWPSNIVGLKDISDAQLRWLYANCSALVAVAKEDFGLTVPEVCSFGRPVVAWRAGGYLDTVAEGINGVFIDEPTPDHILDGLDRLLAIDLPRGDVLADARRFDEETFISRIRDLVTGVLREGGPSAHPVDLGPGQAAGPISLQP